MSESRPLSSHNDEARRSTGLRAAAIGARATEFGSAWDAVERGFRVRHISTFGDDLVCAPPEADAALWLEMNDPDFDQFPVRNNEQTIGILLRHGTHSGRTVAEWMEPLREGLVVSADMPITNLIPEFGAMPYRLVLRGDRIDGLVTRSDLLTLPVRMVTFGLITHIEQLMADWILAAFDEAAAINALPRRRRDKVSRKADRLRRDKLNPPLIELTDFCDKRELCSLVLSSEDRDEFVSDMVQIERLRNSIAHAATFLDDSPGADATQFVAQFRTAVKWIAKLSDQDQMPTEARQPREVNVRGRHAEARR